MSRPIFLISVSDTCSLSFSKIFSNIESSIDFIDEFDFKLVEIFKGFKGFLSSDDIK